MIRVVDLPVLLFAVASLLFRTPAGPLGVAYASTAIGLSILSMISRGANWQVFPAIVVLVVRFLCVDYLAIHPRPSIVLLVKLVGMLGLSASAALLVLMPIPRLPSLWQRPVCTQEIEITSQSGESNERRRMRLRIWAPTLPSRLACRNSVLHICLPQNTSRDSAPVSPYMTRFGIGSVLKAGLSDSIPSVLVSHIALASSNSILSDQISRERPQWPLLLLSHGLTGTPEIYSTYGEQLASLGFIVIAPAHTDGSCSESYLQVNDVWESRHKQLNQRVKDMQSILDELQASQDPPLRSLASRINFSTVGICGHSFGGATAAQLLQKDSRVASGVSWDGWMFPLSTPNTAHNTKPFLFINSDGFHWEENILHMRQWCAHNASGGHIVTLKGTNHHNFNDLPFLGHPSIIKWVSKNTSGWFGESDPLQATKIAVSLAAAFFARVFQTDSPPSPSHLRATIRECILEHTSKVIVDYIPPNAEWRPDRAESARTPNRPKQGAIMSHPPSHTL